MSYYTPPSSGGSGTSAPPSGGSGSTLVSPPTSGTGSTAPRIAGSGGGAITRAPSRSSEIVVPSTRVKNSAVVARHLPEHIREDYPTFVAFVEAYYEFLQAQGVDFSTIRDIDRTLESFVAEFKKELSYNLPNIAQNERFLLQRIKDQYLAKGSEGSYKLLFRLLFGKDVEVFYPGQQMLRVSDGRWNQEISVFAKVDFGDPDNIIGKLVDIQTGGRILRVLVDRKQDLIGEVDRIVLIDPTEQIYEFFLDKRFFGNINPSDKIRYLDEFQATILPATRQVTITQPGKNFRIGQVFELRSGTGTGALMKVTALTAGGGIKYAELIKFGIGYTANFAISLLAQNTVTSRGVGVSSSSTLTQNIDPEDPEAFIYESNLGTPTIGFDEQGYINLGDYITHEYVDGTYAGSLIREFSLNSRNAQVASDDPAIISVTLGALVRYPGYFATNNGFLDDSIFIQDSRYYQAFSYVLKIDERLESYKSAVKTMLHPAGMAVFGEFNVTINHDLSLTLESLVRSLGIGLTDEVEGETDEVFLSTSKVLSTTIDTPNDSLFTKSLSKILATVLDQQNDVAALTTTKAATSILDTPADAETKAFTKSLTTPYSGSVDSINNIDVSKALQDATTATENMIRATTKYVEDVLDSQEHEGYVQLNSYYGQDYIIFEDEYSVGSRESTFTTP